MNSVVDIKARAAQAAEAKRQPHIVIVIIIIVIIIVIIIRIVIVIFHADDDKCRQCWKAGGQGRPGLYLDRIFHHRPQLKPTQTRNCQRKPTKKTQKPLQNFRQPLRGPETGLPYYPQPQKSKKTPKKLKPQTSLLACSHRWLSLPAPPPPSR